MRHCPNCATKFTNHEAFCPYDGTPTIADAKDNVDPWVGVVVDSRYRIESRIGEGGMGIVYRASHVLLNKRIAIKIVRADHAKDSDVAERFMQEARAATSIGHPNIIDINDFGRMPDGSVYFAMEFLSGAGLDEVMEKEPLPMDVAVHVVEQITSALGAAHERGIVHRDLKPDNIFLIKHREDEHFVKVLDFGIAKVAGGSSRTTRAGMVFGTPHYMSPEQAAGQSVDHRTDVYALGVMMYEMFTGQLPFDAETFMGVLTMHMYDPPPLPSSISPEIAERIGDLEGVVLRALSKKPELRYQSMAELCDDMRGVYSGGRKSVALDKTMPPPPRVADEAARVMGDSSPLDASDLGHEFDLAAASLLDNSAGEMVAPPVVTPTNRVPWIAAGVIAVFLIGVVAMTSGGDDATETSESDKPAAASIVSTAEANHARTKPSADTTAGEKPSSAPTVAEQVVVATVAIETDPPGAEVFQAGARVGVTPLSLPRPSAEDALELELKLNGFRAETVRVTAETSERIVTSLAPVAATKQVVATKIKARPTAQPTPSATPSTAQPTTTPKKPLSTGMRDMVDPWAE